MVILVSRGVDFLLGIECNEEDILILYLLRIYSTISLFITVTHFPISMLYFPQFVTGAILVGLIEEGRIVVNYPENWWEL